MNIWNFFNFIISQVHRRILFLSVFLNLLEHHFYPFCCFAINHWPPAVLVGVIEHSHDGEENQNHFRLYLTNFVEEIPLICSIFTWIYFFDRPKFTWEVIQIGGIYFLSTRKEFDMVHTVCSIQYGLEKPTFHTLAPYTNILKEATKHTFRRLFFTINIREHFLSFLF